MGLKRNEKLLLYSIGLSNIGEWIYFIALNLIVLEITGSAFGVSILYMLPYVAGFCTYSWAGSFIDRVNQKHLLIFIDVSRAVLVFIIAFTENVWLIYLLSFIIQCFNKIAEPSSFICMTKIVPTINQQKFNAWRSFVQSAGFFIGPSIAGLLFWFANPFYAILINAAVLLLSASILSSVAFLFDPTNKKEKVNAPLIINDWYEVIRYLRNNYLIAVIHFFISTGVVIMTTLDSLEAAFSTSTIGLNEATYGLLVSIAGLGILIGSILTMKLQITNYEKGIFLGSFGTSVGYLIYATSVGFTQAAIGFFIITFSQSFVNVYFYTFLQTKCSSTILGRFISVFGLYEAFTGLIAILTVGLVAEQVDLRLLILLFSSGLLFFTLITALYYQLKLKGLS